MKTKTTMNKKQFFLISVTIFILIFIVLLLKKNLSERKITQSRADSTHKEAPKESSVFDNLEYESNIVQIKLKEKLIFQDSISGDNGIESYTPDQIVDNNKFRLIQDSLTKYEVTDIFPFAPKRSDDFSKIYSLRVTDKDDVEALIQDLQKDPSVEFAQKAFVYKSIATSNDPYYQDPNPIALERNINTVDGGWNPLIDNLPLPYQWNLGKIGLPDAWQHIGESDTIVAVLDTGVDYNHPDLKDQMWINEDEIRDNGVDDDNNGYVDDWIGWDFNDTLMVLRDQTTGTIEEEWRIQPDNDPMDQPREVFFDRSAGPHIKGGGHGTFIAGIIGSKSDNGYGMAGINPRAKIMALRGCLAHMSCMNYALAQAVIYAVDNGAKVINMSFGQWALDRVLDDALIYAYNRNVILVAAAGNIPSAGVYYPAFSPMVISVGATNERDSVTDYSAIMQNPRYRLDVMAPVGGNNNIPSMISTRAKDTDMYCLGDKNCQDGIITHTDKVIGKDKNFYRAAGTSFAAPQVAALASLIQSKYPNNFNAEQTHNIIRNSAKRDKLPENASFPEYGYGLIDALDSLTKPNTIYPSDSYGLYPNPKATKKWQFEVETKCGYAGERIDSYDTTVKVTMARSGNVETVWEGTNKKIHKFTVNGPWGDYSYTMRANYKDSEGKDVSLQFFRPDSGNLNPTDGRLLTWQASALGVGTYRIRIKAPDEWCFEKTPTPEPTPIAQFDQKWKMSIEFACKENYHPKENFTYDMYTKTFYTPKMEWEQYFENKKQLSNEVKTYEFKLNSADTPYQLFAITIQRNADGKSVTLVPKMVDKNASFFNFVNDGKLMWKQDTPYGYYRIVYQIDDVYCEKDSSVWNFSPQIFCKNGKKIDPSNRDLRTWYLIKRPSNEETLPPTESQLNEASISDNEKNPLVSITTSKDQGKLFFALKDVQTNSFLKLYQKPRFDHLAYSEIVYEKATIPAALWWTEDQIPDWFSIAFQAPDNWCN